MTASNAGTQLSREVRAEASAWIAKLHGAERSPELEEDFRSWLGASAENARAFEHMTEIWDSIAQVDAGGIPRLVDREPRDRFDRPKWRLRFGLVAACALVIALGVAWFVMMGGTYSTGIGEQRIVNLDDGSRIHPNSATTIDVDIGRTARRLRLVRGEAFFDVAKDPTRPFVVTSGRALGDPRLGPRSWSGSIRTVLAVTLRRRARGCRGTGRRRGFGKSEGGDRGQGRQCSSAVAASRCIEFGKSSGVGAWASV